MSEDEVDNKKPSQINSLHQMISSKYVSKMEEVEVCKKRKFQTDQTELSLLPQSKHACFENVACSSNTSEYNSEYSMSNMNSASSMEMEYKNEIEMKEESSGSCGVDNNNAMMMSFESHLDFIYGNEKLEDYSDKDIENILSLHEDLEDNNAANYVLSSGRWTVNQDSTRHGTIKPTIDQEFEQYFSTLML